MSHKHISKLMSLVLRHNPSVIGVELDENGWLTVEELINGINRKGIRLDLDELTVIVETNNKQRFAFNEDKTKIRANQGHSINVDVELKTQVPPDILYHGTVNQFLDAIFSEGLKPMNRQHVHLSADLETATKVGGRRGKPVILEVAAKDMHASGCVFFRSENGVWLTDAVDPEFISKSK